MENLNALYGYGYLPDLGTDSDWSPTTADVLARQNALYAGPGGALRSARDAIPESPNALSILNMARSGLGTAANWLQGTPVIGPDTIAPLGLAPMGSLVGHSASLAKPSVADSARARYLEWKHPDDFPAISGGEGQFNSAKYLGEADRMARESPHSIRDARLATDYPRETIPSPANDGSHIDIAYLKELAAQKARNEFRLLSDQSKASVPGTVVNSVDAAGQRAEGAATPRRDTAAAAALPERPVAAAVRLPNGKVYTGALHSDAVEAAMKAGEDIDFDRFMAMPNAMEADGFVTNTGRYVTRHEGTDLIKNADPSVRMTAGILDARSLPLDSSTRQQAKASGAEPSITAYHGSPHDFDRFDMSRIGTGEGAQAYGHGLYMAESRDVADTYRTAGSAGNVPSSTYKAPSDVLARHAEDFGKLAVSDALLVKGFGALDVERRGMVVPMMRGVLEDPEIAKAVVRLLPVDVVHMLGGKKLAPQALLDNPSMLVDLLPANANDLVPGRVQAIDVLAPYVARATAERPLIGTQSRALLEKALAARRAGKGDLHVSSEIPYPSKSGKMYEVRINADPESFLDWDKPLSQQGEAVREHLSAMKKRLEDYGAHPIKDTIADLSMAYNKRSTGYEGEFEQSLRQKGIPGIKYLDQGSRTPKILFDDQPVVKGAKGNWAVQSAAESLDLHGTPEKAIEALSGQTRGHGGDAAREAIELLRSGRVAKHQPEGTRNFVIFDAQIVDILKKYGLAGAIGAGAMSQDNQQ